MSRAYWERHAVNYDLSMRVLGRPLPGMLSLIREAIHATHRVLEVGAGTGLVTSLLSAECGQVEATDYSGAMVAQLRRRIRAESLPNVRVTEVDIAGLPFEPGTFDAVVAANVLHLVPDMDEALRRLAGMLRTGGLLVAPTFCHGQTRVSRLTSKILGISGFPGHRRLTVEALEAAVARAGLVVRRVDLVHGILPIGHVEALKE